MVLVVGAFSRVYKKTLNAVKHHRCESQEKNNAFIKSSSGNMSSTSSPAI